MDSRTALTLSIGVLGGLAVVLTAEVITVPIWVVFLAWASFFFVGGDITITTISHPGLVAAVACVLGASFGLLSEYVATATTKKPARQASADAPSTEGSPA